MRMDCEMMSLSKDEYKKKQLNYQNQPKKA